MIGHVVGKYKILEKIGEGGMGSVYRAEHTVLGSPAAVKVLLPMWTQDAVVVDRFFHEAKAASAIRHVGIVDVFDYGRLPNDQAWIAMELLRGENLTELLMRTGRPLDPSLVQQLAIQILAALDAAHVAGVVHRDLKPDNIYLVRDPSAPAAVRVKVLDAGANEVLASVARGEADFGLNFMGAQEGDLDFKPLGEERFVAACRRDHPIARMRRVTWAELARHDFIAVARSSGNRLLLDQALAGVESRPQSIYETQHVTTTLGLVEAGLVTQVDERKVRGIHEGIYQATARSYWLSPTLVGRIGGLRRTRDELSLGYVLDLMEEVQTDIAALDRSAPELPSIGVSGEIRVPPDRRREFFEDLRGTLQDLFSRYGGSEGDAFKLAVACYPKGDQDHD